MLKLKLVKNGAEATLMMEGRIDANNSPAVKDKLLELVKSYDSIIMDLAELRYISSAGLRAFKSLHLEMRNKGGTLLIRNTRPDVMAIFNVTGFNRILDFA